MTTGALIFLLVSWAAVLSVTGWAFRRILFPSRPTDAVRNGQPPPPGSA